MPVSIKSHAPVRAAGKPAAAPKSAAALEPEPAAKPLASAKPLPPPPRRYLARCTFVGEDKKTRLEGSFRIVAEAVDVGALLPKLEKAVKKLRRSGELPARCEVFVEFILELAELDRGIVADFERWERHPRRFQHGCITLAETGAVFDHGLPSYHFGKPLTAPTPATSSPPASGPASPASA